MRAGRKRSKPLTPAFSWSGTPTRPSWRSSTANMAAILGLHPRLTGRGRVSRMTESDCSRLLGRGSDTYFSSCVTAEWHILLTWWECHIFKLQHRFSGTEPVNQHFLCVLLKFCTKTLGSWLHWTRIKQFIVRNSLDGVMEGHLLFCRTFLDHIFSNGVNSFSRQATWCWFKYYCSKINHPFHTLTPTTYWNVALNSEFRIINIIKIIKASW